MCNDQIRVTGITISLNIHLFFMLGIFQIHSSSYTEIYNKLLLSTVILLCYQTLELIPTIKIFFFFLPIHQPLFIPPSPLFFPASGNGHSSTFMRLIFLVLTYEQKYAICVFLCLVWFCCLFLITILL